jgi:hypothetical protein
MAQAAASRQVAAERRTSIGRHYVAANGHDKTRLPVRARRWHARILRACLRDSTGAEARALALAAPPDALRTLPASAALHRVVGPLHEALRESLPSDAAGRLEGLYREECARHLLVTANLRRVQDLLERAAIPFLVVKGPAVAALAYRRPRVRFYQDLDIVVRRQHFGAALDLFEANGADVVDPNWSYHSEHVAGEIRLSTGVDLHWHLLFFHELRNTTAISMDEMFARERPVSLAGTSVLTTDPADTLIHLCLHACLEGGGRLIWLKDIERVVANDAPAWEDVIERSLRWRVNLFVGAMLMRSRSVLDTPVPDAVIRTLLPSSAWRTTLSAADRFFPVASPRRRETPATLIAQGTQVDVKSTVGFLTRVAARRGLTSAAELFGRHAEESDAGIHASAGEERAAFLARVASGA